MTTAEYRVMTRLEANREIVKRVSRIVEVFPDWRFHQILQNMGLESASMPDKFYEESEDTLKSIAKDLGHGMLEANEETEL